MNFKFLSAFLLFLFWGHISSSAAQLIKESKPRVSLKNEPDPSKLCISITFPMHTEPVFVCTDKGEIEYIPKCTNPRSISPFSSCPKVRNDTLRIHMPWECCDVVSAPNDCSLIQCPPKPFNRTCRIERKLGECCPTYYCDKEDPEHCKLQKTRPYCTFPPPGKKDCIGFRDPYGCCTKFQCSGEGKPGSCPSPLPLKTKFTPNSGFGNLIADFSVLMDEAKQTFSTFATSVSDYLETEGGSIGSKISRVIPKFDKFGQLRRCTGDWTCPSSSKCCPHQNTRLWMWKSTKENSNSGDSLVDGVCLNSGNEVMEDQREMGKTAPGQM